jgi:hypothetical protein
VSLETRESLGDARVSLETRESLGDARVSLETRELLGDARVSLKTRESLGDARVSLESLGESRVSRDPCRQPGTPECLGTTAACLAGPSLDTAQTDTA